MESIFFLIGMLLLIGGELLWMFCKNASDLKKVGMFFMIVIGAMLIGWDAGKLIHRKFNSKDYSLFIDVREVRLNGRILSQDTTYNLLRIPKKE